MKTNLILSFLVGLMPLASVASPVSPEDAVIRYEQNLGRKIRSANEAPKFVETIFNEEGVAVIYHYTFSGDRGFLLLPANDAVPALLGYSETNSFKSDNMSPSLKSWLSLYGSQIAEAGDSPALMATGTRAAERAAIEPMIKTQWDQSTPYNYQCPTIDGRRSVTGCVATAMAQVMNYWQYPATGKGSISYSPQSTDQELSLDFSEITFDWENMKNKYGWSDKPSSPEVDAVSTLMKACGYSVKMQYTSWESGAYSRDIPNALLSYFGYDQGVSRKERSNFSSLEEWDQMVYNELVNVGPVICSGQSTSGAHCFVCDGYDGNGMFHINWGWGGMSDGYFLLNELTPGEIGTGGHYGGYNMNQEVIVGVMPPVGRLTLENIAIDNAAEDSGNVKGWGYTYRINDFSNILLTLSIRISGGHITSPLYVTVYDTDPDTKKLGEEVLATTFPEPLNVSDGLYTFSTTLKLNKYDPSKLYTLRVAYDLKGQRTTIESIRMAASSGVDDITADTSSLVINQTGKTLETRGEGDITLSVYDIRGALVIRTSGIEPALSLENLSPGVYVAKAVSEFGETKTLKLLLK